VARSLKGMTVASFAGVLVGAMVSPPSAASTTAAALRCTLQATPQTPVGQPLPLRFTLTNTGAAPLKVLRWNTPFEGAWFAPFVIVTRDGGRALPYRGPMLKRGDPAADDYLPLEPGQSINAEVDLAQAFDLSRPGRYRVQPRIRLIDVVAPAAGASAPRARAQHQGAELACPAIGVTLAD
jgi:hypothetical protein